MHALVYATLALVTLTSIADAAPLSEAELKNLLARVRGSELTIDTAKQIRNIAGAPGFPDPGGKKMLTPSRTERHDAVFRQVCQQR